MYKNIIEQSGFSLDRSLTLFLFICVFHLHGLKIYQKLL